MQKIKLENVTLIGIDCIDPKRLQEVINISSLEINFGNTKILSSIPIKDPRFIQIPHIPTIEEYSRFCINDLHKYVDTEYCLLIQWDGFILNPKVWEDSFIKYDYIGAPWVVKDWSINDFDFPKELRGQRVVGNGGFSMRSKKLLEISSKLSKEGKITRFHPEDIALCVWHRDELEKLGINFAPIDTAKRFSIEGADDVYKKQFGFHGFYATDIDTWFDEYQEYSKLRQLYEKTKITKHHTGWKVPKL